MSHFLYRIGNYAARRPWRVIATWLVVAGAVFMLNSSQGGEFDESFSLPGSESQRAADAIEERFPQETLYASNVIFHSEDGLTDPATKAAIEQAVAELTEGDHVIAVSSPYDPRGPTVSEDGQTAFATVAYDTEEVGLEEFDVAEEAVQDVRDAGVEVEYDGDLGYAKVEKGGNSELIGILLAVVILAIAFGSLVAMSLPIVAALLAIVVGSSTIGIMAGVVAVPEITSVVAMMLGLGVGIDYALFILSRHRQNLASGQSVPVAVGRANATAGLSVLFAGVTVMVAILGLKLSGSPDAGEDGLRLGIDGRGRDACVDHAASRDARSGQAPGEQCPDPVRQAEAGGQPGRLLGPVGRAGRRQACSLRRRGSGGPRRACDPAVLDAPRLRGCGQRRTVVDDSEGLRPRGRRLRSGHERSVRRGARDRRRRPDPLRVLEDVAASLGNQAGVASVDAPVSNEAGDVAIIGVTPTTSPQDDETGKLLERLRDDALPAALSDSDVEASITGNTAITEDVSSRLQDRMPLFLGAVIGLSFLVLMVVFRSVLVPLKAAALNVLGVGAAYGVIVAVFQWGWAADLIGVHENVPIMPLAPMLMFAILFGLSMDYEVFLMSRVREQYRKHFDPRRAVIEGVGSTARVITCAALIMIGVFASFILDTDVTTKMFGVGLSIAVLLDVTLIRMVLVPAVMSLLGHRAWWLPAWLERWLPAIDVEGGAYDGEELPELEPVLDEPEREAALV